MKQLTCELCGSSDLLKNDVIFACQSCGLKYSEEAKKMIIDGVVEIRGTVTVDESANKQELINSSRKFYICTNYKGEIIYDTNSQSNICQICDNFYVINRFSSVSNYIL